MKAMKKLLAMFMALSLVFALAACGDNGGDNTQTPSQAGAESAAPAGSEEPANSDAGTETDSYGEFTTVEEGKLIMSTNAAFPPYEMTTDDGGFEGIDVEIAGAIAEKLGLELVIDNMDFTAALQAAQSGMSDMVMAGVHRHQAAPDDLGHIGPGVDAQAEDAHRGVVPALKHHEGPDQQLEHHGGAPDNGDVNLKNGVDHAQGRIFPAGALLVVGGAHHGDDHAQDHAHEQGQGGGHQRRPRPL